MQNNVSSFTQFVKDVKLLTKKLLQMVIFFWIQRRLHKFTEQKIAPIEVYRNQHWTTRFLSCTLLKARRLFWRIITIVASLLQSYVHIGFCPVLQTSSWARQTSGLTQHTCSYMLLCYEKLIMIACSQNDFLKYLRDLREQIPLKEYEACSSRVNKKLLRTLKFSLTKKLLSQMLSEVNQTPGFAK